MLALSWEGRLVRAIASTAMLVPRAAVAQHAAVMEVGALFEASRFSGSG